MPESELKQARQLCVNPTVAGTAYQRERSGHLSTDDKLAPVLVTMTTGFTNDMYDFPKESKRKKTP